MVLDNPIKITEQNWPEGTQPVVSVFSWVYNHIDYIRESIESILEQKTTFPVEIILHDDASNDGTAEIIKEYEKKYPKLFKNILQKKNQWSQGNSVMSPLFEKPKGKYIALTHGDDYWTDPYKLQKQVEILESNNQYSFTHTDVQGLQNGKFISPTPFKRWNKVQTITKLENALKVPVAFTCTVMFRNYKNLNKYLTSLNNAGDWQLWVVLMLFGDAYYVDYCSSVYRIGTGISSSPAFKPNDGWAYFLLRLSINRKKISYHNRVLILKHTLGLYINKLKVLYHKYFNVKNLINPNARR
jgi:glycosyltransferase involved in cell wall biosynthesis